MKKLAILALDRELSFLSGPLPVRRAPHSAQEPRVATRGTSPSPRGA